MAAAALLLMLAAPVRAQQVHDPLEPLNRTIFSLNELLDLMFIEPASSSMAPALTDDHRRAQRAGQPPRPGVFANDLMQAEGDRAGMTLARFMINSSLGVLGLFDLATEFGFPGHSEDFGQTLAVWGLGEGPYLVVPILGPSTVRDTGGLAVDAFVIDPWGYVDDRASLIRAGAEVVDTRYRLTPVIDDLRQNSLDRYATARSAYLQRRAAEIRNGAPAANPDNYNDIFKDEDSQ